MADRQTGGPEAGFRKRYQEELDKVTAVAHVRTDYFRSHTKLEGYEEITDSPSYLFHCDRLLKSESMYVRLQLGYNPNRRGSFLFVHLKSSRYDTVNSQSRKELLEYQRNTARKGGRGRAFTAKRRGESAVLIEKRGGRPWSEQAILSRRRELDENALEDVMPFLFREKDRERQKELRAEGRQLQEQMRMNLLEGDFQENISLRQQQIQLQMEENLLNHLILCKESASRNLLGQVSRSYEGQKHEMFEYYKNRMDKEEYSEQEIAADSGEDGADENK